MNYNNFHVGFKAAFKSLVDAFRPATYENGAPKARAEKVSKRQKTKKGAEHTVNPVFKARKLMAATPAQYRHQHLGIVSSKDES